MIGRRTGFAIVLAPFGNGPSPAYVAGIPAEGRFMPLPVDIGRGLVYGSVINDGRRTARNRVARARQRRRGFHRWIDGRLGDWCGPVTHFGKASKPASNIGVANRIRPRESRGHPDPVHKIENASDTVGIADQRKFFARETIRWRRPHPGRTRGARGALVDWRNGQRPSIVDDALGQGIGRGLAGADGAADELADFRLLRRGHRPWSRGRAVRSSPSPRGGGVRIKSGVLQRSRHQKRWLRAGSAGCRGAKPAWRVSGVRPRRTGSRADHRGPASAARGELSASRGGFSRFQRRSGDPARSPVTRAAREGVQPDWRRRTPAAILSSTTRTVAQARRYSSSSSRFRQERHQDRL